MLEEILEFNKKFVENRGYEKYITNKYPDKKIAIRYDENVIGNHLRMLADDPAMQRLYELLSRSIHERQ